MSASGVALRLLSAKSSEADLPTSDFGNACALCIGDGVKPCCTLESGPALTVLIEESPEVVAKVSDFNDIRFAPVRGGLCLGGRLADPTWVMVSEELPEDVVSRTDIASKSSLYSEPEELQQRDIKYIECVLLMLYLVTVSLLPVSLSFLFSSE
jgi:hypothetical protein